MKKLGLFLLLAIIGALIYAYLVYYPQLAVVNSYSARLACTCHFVGHRSLEKIKNEDLAMAPLNLADVNIDEKSKTVTSSVFGLKPMTAKYRKNQGCVVIHGQDNYDIAYAKSDSNYIESSFATSRVSYPELNRVIENYFQNLGWQFRSLLVIKNDSIIAERYSEGINKETPQLGWSMTKSITNALIGIAVKDSILSLKDDQLFSQWKKDPRKNITIENLLHMNPGFEWKEEYDDISDATEMLFLDENMLPNLLDNVLEFTPGEHWEYSSGNTNLLMAILRQQLGDETYWAYPKERLFKPLGMSTAFIETDEAGNFIGSSYGYASLRDWAKFGKLFLNKGIDPGGNTLLPENWVEYSVGPAGGKINYNGAHWWINKEHSTFKDAPEDLFYASGYQGQYVYIIPSLDMIIVRTGLSGNYDENIFLKRIIETSLN